MEGTKKGKDGPFLLGGSMHSPSLEWEGPTATVEVEAHRLSSSPPFGRHDHRRYYHRTQFHLLADLRVLQSKEAQAADGESRSAGTEIPFS